MSEEISPPRCHLRPTIFLTPTCHLFSRWHHLIESSVSHECPSGAKLTMSGPMVPLPPRPNVAVRINGVIDMSVLCVEIQRTQCHTEMFKSSVYYTHTRTILTWSEVSHDSSFLWNSRSPVSIPLDFELANTAGVAQPGMLKRQCQPIHPEQIFTHKTVRRNQLQE